MQAIIDLNPVEPARLGFRQARGCAFGCDFTFRGNTTPGAQQQLVDIGTVYPQLIFRPHTRGGASAYDLTVVDAVSGRAHLDVPGAYFSDPRGYGLELYFRDSQGSPQAMVAYGTMAITGGAYQYEGPLFSATLPTGPAGAQGPAGMPGATGPMGVQGLRGGTWSWGHGDPTVPGGVNGDMYLNVDGGDVWMWTGITWVQT